MASDIYNFEGKYKNLTIHISACECREINKLCESDFENFCGLSIYSLTGDEITSLKRIGKIRRAIRNGLIPMEYKGGWCSSGYTWGPDDIRHYSSHEEGGD